MVPLVSGITPAIAERRVDFPLPTGPVIAVKVPDSAVNAMLCRIYSSSRLICSSSVWSHVKSSVFSDLPPYHVRKRRDVFRDDLLSHFSLNLEDFRWCYFSGHQQSDRDRWKADSPIAKTLLFCPARHTLRMFPSNHRPSASKCSVLKYE